MTKTNHMTPEPAPWPVIRLSPHPGPFNSSTHPKAESAVRLQNIYLRHRIISSIPDLRQLNPNGENDKLEGVLPDFCEMNGSYRKRRPPCCFGAGVGGHFDAKEGERRGRRSFYERMRGRTLGAGQVLVESSEKTPLAAVEGFW
jgi:hypothetical protein